MTHPPRVCLRVRWRLRVCPCMCQISISMTGGGVLQYVGPCLLTSHHHPTPIKETKNKLKKKSKFLQHTLTHLNIRNRYENLT